MGHHRLDLADCRHRFWNVYSYVMHGARHLEAFLQSRIGDGQEPTV